MTKTTLILLLVLVGGLIIGASVVILLRKLGASLPTIGNSRSDDHTWLITQNTNPDSPGFILRINETAKNFEGKPAFPYQFYLTIPIKSPKPDGLPTTDEYDALVDIENAAVAMLEKANESILVAVVTTQGKRDMIFYSVNREGPKSKVAQLQQQNPSHELLFEIQDDPQWKIYKDLLEIIEGH